MKTKYVIICIGIIAAVIVAAIALRSQSWQKANRVDNHVEGDQSTHAHDDEHLHEHGEAHADERGVTHVEKTVDDHTDDEGKEAHGEEVVRLTDAEMKEFGIVLEAAGAGVLNKHIELPGEIVLNSDGIAHVVPRVAGIVREVLATVGQRVEKGQLLAVLESRELADAKATYLAAVERENLAQGNFIREERLWERKVTSQQEYLDARQTLAETRIAKNSAEQQLYALGCNKNDLLTLKSSEHASFTHYTITSPLSGTVIERHITFGENVTADSDVFTIADLSTVWVNINVYQKHLGSIRNGQTVRIDIGHGVASVDGEIAWVGPQVDEATRTVKARVELSNPNGDIRPGLFVTAKVAVENSPAAIVVPKSALQTFEGRTVIFVRTDKGLEPMPVEIGRQNDDSVEIISGLTTGQTYVSHGAFTLKAQLSKNAFGDGHNH